MRRIQLVIFFSLLGTAIYTLSHLGVFQRVGHDLEEALEELDLDEEVEVVLLDPHGKQVAHSQELHKDVYSRSEHEEDSEHIEQGHAGQDNEHHEQGVRHKQGNSEEGNEGRERDKEEWHSQGGKDRSTADLHQTDSKSDQHNNIVGEEEDRGDKEQGHHIQRGEAEDTHADMESQTHKHKEDKPEKIGAGLLFISGTSPDNMEVLLLRRRSKHNHNTWGLPGGNMDDEDEGDLLRTALREGVEELGQLPASYTQVGAMLTKRGKRGQKHYTVFVMRLSDQVRSLYRPSLDPHEHSEWRWFRLSDIQLRHASAHAGSGMLQGTGDSAGRLNALPATENELLAMELHPVVEKVLEQAGGQLLQKLGVL